MSTHQVLAMVVAGPMFLIGGGLAWILYMFLPAYHLRDTLAVTTLVVSIALASLVFYLLSRLCRPRAAKIVVAVAIIAVALPIGSMFAVSKFTYARFGFSVYGLVPVPALDITINEHGMLWFREKSHLATLEEVKPLLSDDVEVLIIGTGWHGVMRVEEAVSQLDGVEVIILKTPQAFELFNQLKAAGRNVVMLAHSTC